MVELRSSMRVDLMDSMGDDSSVAWAARVSTQGADSASAGNNGDKLINFLMKNRHGTPFEHNSMTFYVEAPIFVFREFHRHRAGWSYNEESGRYRELQPVFYAPDHYRNLVQAGKPGAYVFVPGSPEQYQVTRATLRAAYKGAYEAYELLLRDGVAREVARTVLPVGIYSSMYATCNARSLMHFLSLRTTSVVSRFPSYPQREIEMVGEKMEEEFRKQMPVTWAAFNTHGRVAP